MKRQVLFALAAGAATTAAVAVAVAWWHAGKADRALLARMQARAVAATSPATDCLKPTGRRLVLLVLGQSNAGNHGAETEPEARGEGPMVTVFDGSGCRLSADPLPGGTGRHRSIWTRLEPQLRQRGVQAELLVALLAVDSTTIEDWTREGSPLRAELARLMQSLSRASLKPDAVLWQQGESDARQGTTSQLYESRFARLLADLRQAGIQAPVLIARSTRCRNVAGEGIRIAQANLVSRHEGLTPGPDTDLLAGSLRDNDCHWSRAGIDAAAAAWATAITGALEKR